MRLESVICVLLNDVCDLRRYDSILNIFPNVREKVIQNRGIESWADYKMIMDKEDHVKQHCTEKIIQTIRSRLGRLCHLRRLYGPMHDVDIRDNIRQYYNIFTPPLKEYLNRVMVPYHSQRELCKTSAIVHVEDKVLVVPNTVLFKIISITSMTIFTETLESTCILSVECNDVVVTEKEIIVSENGVAQMDLFDGIVGVYGEPWNSFGHIKIRCSVPITSIIFTGWKAMLPDQEIIAADNSPRNYLPYSIPKPCVFKNANGIRNIHTHEDGICYNGLIVAEGMTCTKYA